MAIDLQTDYISTFCTVWVSLVFVQYPTCCVIHLLSSVRVLYILHGCAKFLLCLPGSSRQFTGFSTDVEESIINRIWERAGVFFPTLRELSLPNFVRSRKIRVGLRPYSKWALWVLCTLNFWWKVLRLYLYWVLHSYSYCEFHCNLFKEHHHAITEWCQIISVIDGKPLIGPIPGIPKVFLATGHEGEGLCTVSYHLMSGIRLYALYVFMKCVVAILYGDKRVTMWMSCLKSRWWKHAHHLINALCKWLLE